MTTPLYTTGTVLTSAQQREHSTWLSVTNWQPNQLTPGAIKVGSRWQPITARCVPTRSGFLTHFDHVTVAEQRGYPTKKAARDAARQLISK